MILADTSVWIDHFRRGEPRLVAALEEGEVLVHPYVIGELACGNFRDRGHTLGLLMELPAARVASHAEVLAMIEGRRLFGLGIGYVDAHLLAATALTLEAQLWTNDKRLASVASRLRLD